MAGVVGFMDGRFKFAVGPSNGSGSMGKKAGGESPAEWVGKEKEQ